MEKVIDTASLFVIFGGTGDLTHRKLVPAIYNLAHGDLLPKDFALVAIGRRDYTTEKYHHEIYQSIKKHTRHNLNQDIFGMI